MKRPMVYVFAFMFIGMMFGQYFPQRESIALFCMFVGLFSLLIAAYRKIFACVLLPLAAMLGFFVMCHAGYSQTELEKNWIADNSVIFIEGEVTSNDYAYDNKNKVIIKCSKIFDDISSEDVNFKIYTYTADSPNIGQNVVIMGKLFEISAPKNISDYDMRLYYKALKIRYGFESTKITYKELNKNLFYHIFKLRQRLSAVYDNILPSEEASIMKAIILGESSGIDDEVYNNLADAGIVHIVAVSGLHIGIFACLIAFLTRPINKILSFVITVALLTLYCIMTGFGVSSQRALIMTTVLLTGNLLHRDYDIISSACVAAIIILCISPYSIYGIGFQYSFCTVVGIGFATEFIRKQKIKNKALSAIIVSLAASIFGKPIGILHNYRITFTDILANLVITGIVSVIFTLGLIGGILGIFSITLGRFAVSNAYLLLKYTLFVGNLFANIPFSYISVGSFSFGGIIFIYISMICVYNIITDKNYGYGVSLALITLSLLTLNTKNIKHPERKEVITGSKYCEVITSPSDCFVINCGDNRYQNSGRRTLLPYLRYNSVNRINGVFLTDAKFKNIDGLTDILGKICIDKIYISETVEKNYEYKKLTKLAEKYKTEVIPVYENEVIECDDVTVSCIYDNDNLTIDTNIGE